MASSPAVFTHFASYEASVPRALEDGGLAEALGAWLERRDDERPTVMLKPNLVSAADPPVTTAVGLCEAAAAHVLDKYPVRVVAAEGTGDPCRSTLELFEMHGYAAMARRIGVELEDLNDSPIRKIEGAPLKVFEEMWLPESALDAFLISLPVLKPHSLAGFTGSLKNLLGLAPPLYFGQTHGSWRKAAFHHRIQSSILDLLSCRTPDFALLDASMGLADHHLGGRVLDPGPGVLVSGADGWEVDRAGARLLGIDWRSVGHLARRG
jgi:uncharacterized protein (DUF362 family)